ncbi:hypothetical protein BHM03_00009790 [Ensete ventricosum]|uniref:X8 domain-containing protein n=1 Tax=Ensete ventricosum TaxID=4639 RepID=A0A445MCV3_ENSVE|nr:hypothetical protein BHM03_00009790 [Ensete ventricosum]
MGHRTKEGGGALRVGRHEGTGVERALFLRWAEAGWCLCKPELGDTALQKTLDYACGAGADCTPILQTGACYIPNTVKDHCSNYACFLWDFIVMLSNDATNGGRESYMK